MGLTSLSRRMRNAYVLLVVSLLPLGCMTWEARHARVGDVLAARRESVIRVTDSSSMRFVHTPYVRGDSLFGWTHEATSPVNGRVAMHLGDIKAVSVQRFSFGHTVLVGFGLGLGILAMLVMTAEPFTF